MAVSLAFNNPSLVVARQVEEDDDRRTRFIQRAWQYYDGAMPSQLKVKPGDYDDNVRLEYPRVIIDTSVGFLFGDDCGFEASDDRRQELVDAAWGTNEQKMTTLNRIGVNGGVVGHAFVKLAPQENGTTRVVVLDPGNVRVDWAPDDFSNIIRYNIEWTGWDETLQKAVSFRQVVENTNPEGDGPWLITDSRSVGGSVWVPTGEDEWNFPFAPIVDCQNLPTANEFYGYPDIDNGGMDLVDRINQAASNIQKILRYHAHPKVFIYGYSGADIDMSVDKAVNFPSTDTSVGILGMPTELNAAFAMLDRLTEALLLQTRTPRAALGDPAAAAAAASGLAMKLGFMPLIDKTSTKRQTYGYLLNEVNQRVQAIAGLEPTEVPIRWADITPDDPLSDIQVALLKEQAGVSKSTVLQELGYDPDMEEDKRNEEGEAAADAMANALSQGTVNSLTATGGRAMAQQPAQQRSKARDLMADNNRGGV